MKNCRSIMRGRPVSRPFKTALGGITISLVAAVLSAGTAAAETSSCANGEAQALIVSDVSGRLGVLGPSQASATQTAIDLINKDGGLLGCKVSLTIKDEQLDPAVAVRELKKAIATNKPNVVFGPTLSSSMLSMAKITNAQEIPLFSGEGADAQFVMDAREPGNYMAISTLYQDGRAAAKYLIESGKCKRYGFLYPDIVAGRDVVSAFRGQLTESQPDAQIVVDQPYNLQNKDFGAIIQAISSKSPDCVFGNLLGPDLGSVYKIWNQRKLDILTMFYPDTATLKAVGNGNLPANTYGVMRANVKIMSETPVGKEFTEAYKAANGGSTPDEWAYAAASAVQMWASVVKAAGSFDYNAMDAAVKKGGLTFDSVYGNDTEIMPNHQANAWSNVGPIVDDSQLGHPYWSSDSKSMLMKDVIQQPLYDSILAGKSSTRWTSAQ
ncbi:ABC-type branched-subunit amino acid transport system substrate-binding protein [Aminobacter lissarensis]|uniref:ABC-type branched-subunit amino acid transport system substrate-binding protein n=1 Tax=Aminobacter carboxidus TaxID=376165 RepID=A0A8E1WM94_9HYPH|nr:ABC transporter substrate-binding protein [Aminobacter lissarensis]MBB6469872.1 ABC-type branched-subunit amino acid transport system substrate-binding protein [Aminobacter lissarensis]